MELNDFNSLIEIICVINLAYIINDQLQSANYILLITEKILRKYDNVYENVKEGIALLSFYQTSLNELSEKIAKQANSDTVKTELEDGERILVLGKKKLDSAKKDIDLKIKESYQTKSFSYLSFYLFLYCILILTISGASSILNNERLASSVLAINIFTLIFLYVSLTFDRIDPNKKLNRTCKLVLKIASLIKYNGYKLTILYFLILFIFAIVAYCIKPFISLSFFPTYLNILILLTIIFPFLNFIAYFFKASQRSDSYKEDLDTLSKTILDDLKNDMQKIQQTIDGQTYIIDKNYTIVPAKP